MSIRSLKTFSSTVRTKVIGKNRVKSGNGENGILDWIAYDNPKTLAHDGTYFVIEDDNGSTLEGMYQDIPVNSNLQYTIKFTGKAGTIRAILGAQRLDSNKGYLSNAIADQVVSATSDTTVNVTFNSSTAQYIRILAFAGYPTEMGIAYFKEISMVEGATALATYEPYTEFLKI